MDRVFITGIAGFIGFHLARALKNRGDFVVGIDSFNSYYDPRLKRERAELLAREGIEVMEGNILNTEALKKILKEQNITHFVHLAAQAGVRHSIAKPDEYVSANLQGFVSVLETCRAFPHVKLVYASSSSVYGLNTKIPFAPEDPTDQPANLYGATKKANEAMAHSYHHLFGLSVTGLRYFTVYGPWGRPDMAYYQFSQKIVRGEKISLFNEGKMKRDFTYIDDIVDGTIAAMDVEGYQIFNLGNQKPVELLSMVDLLETFLGQTAEKEWLPMQPGEVLETYAEISKSQKILGYCPKVSIEEGLEQFVHWFRKRGHL